MRLLSWMNGVEANSGPRMKNARLRNPSILQLWLKSVVQGYLNYHAIPGNLDSLRVFRVRVTRLWRQVLRRRGQKHHLNWKRMRQFDLRQLCA